ncbi:MAG: hypothetical protein SPF70_03130 [Lachnospiraceae bacterium]|nr:hypothetical protein [Lachnospiraceae bacterium]
MRKKDLDKDKNKKKVDGDTITVLAILGSIIIIAVVFALIQGGHSDVKVSGGLGNQQNITDRETSVKIVLAATALSIFFVALFIMKKIHDKKNKEKEKQLEKARKLKELEEARERVKKAKMDEFLMKSQSELEKRKRESELLRRTSKRRQPEHRSLDGQQAYVRRDLNLYRDDDLEETKLEWKDGEKEGFFSKLLHKLKNIFGHKS